MQQWNRQKQAKIAISQPFLWNQYNEGMGGVDQADQNIETYQIAFKTKKCWWAFFVRILEMVLQHALILHRINRQPQDPNLDLLAFRREIMNNYLKKYVCHNQSGRPRGRILPVKCRVKDEIHLDRIDYFNSSFMIQKRCWLCCKNTRKGCSKGNVNIHGYCFKEWHGIQ